MMLRGGFPVKKTHIAIFITKVGLVRSGGELGSDTHTEAYSEVDAGKHPCGSLKLKNNRKPPSGANSALLE
jgi:hypothetical protein